MQELGKMEDQIFKDRQDKEQHFKARNKAKRRRERLEQNCAPKWVPEGQFAPMVNISLQYNTIKFTICFIILCLKTFKIKQCLIMCYY